LRQPRDCLRLHLENPRRHPFDELVMNLLRLEVLDEQDITLLRILPPRERLAYVRAKVHDKHCVGARMVPDGGLSWKRTSRKRMNR